MPCRRVCRSLECIRYATSGALKCDIILLHIMPKQKWAQARIYRHTHTHTQYDKIVYSKILASATECTHTHTHNGKLEKHNVEYDANTDG